MSGCNLKDYKNFQNLVSTIAELAIEVSTSLERNGVVCARFDQFLHIVLHERVYAASNVCFQGLMFVKELQKSKK